MKKNLPGRGLTEVEKHWCKRCGIPYCTLRTDCNFRR